MLIENVGTMRMRGKACAIERWSYGWTGADSEEKHEPAGDIDTVVVDSLKALDPERPIREADIQRRLDILDNGSQLTRP
jgi:hypothetical protein